MEVAFSAKPHTPIFYVPLPFPHSISNRLEFLRRGSHSRPSSGLRPLKRSKKSELKIHPSRCLYDDFSYEESVIAVAAVAAAFTAFQLMHTKKRSESLHLEEKLIEREVLEHHIDSKLIERSLYKSKPDDYTRQIINNNTCSSEVPPNDGCQLENAASGCEESEKLVVGECQSHTSAKEIVEIGISYDLKQPLQGSKVVISSDTPYVLFPENHYKSRNLREPTISNCTVGAINDNKTEESHETSMGLAKQVEPSSCMSQETAYVLNSADSLLSEAIEGIIGDDGYQVAAAAGFDMDPFQHLKSFSENFGASCLKEVGSSFMDLWKNKHEKGKVTINQDSVFEPFSGLKVCDTFFFKPCKDDAAIRRKADASREFIISRHNQFVYEGKNKTFEMPQEFHLEKGMHSTISDRKQHNAVKKGIGPCHTVSTSCNNSFPSGVNCQETSVCGKEEELDLRSISRFRSLIAEPLQFILLPNNSLHGQSSHDLKVQNVLAKSYYFTVNNAFYSDNTKIQSPRARFKDASEREEKVLNKMNGHTQDMTKKLRRERNDSLLSRFPQLNGNLEKSTNGFSQWLRTYNHLLRAGRLKECIDLLENTERMGLLDMNKVHHMSFLNACKSQKAVKEAFQFCKLIQNPTMSTFNTLLSVCANSQDYEGAVQVMLLIKEAALKPDCKLYTTLISTCAKSGKVDAMFEVFNTSLRQSMDMEHLCFNNLVYACIDFKLDTKVFHEMVNSGIEPNVNTYGALIDGCARAGQVAKAFGAYGIMRSKKVQPDRVVFNALITACGESGAVDRAFDVLSEMRAEPKPIDPDHVTIGALIKACTKADQVDRTREVYKMLQEYNITGTPEVYTIAVRSCSQIGDLEFGLGIYDDMKRNGVRPDEMFLSTLIDVAGHAGKVDAAFKILQDAKADGIKVGTMSYSSLMGACCNAKNWNKALELYEEIKTLRLLPTVSLLNALITSL
ncbi:hypothetical protein ZIOFF_058230 [Zingiber officinale]|uniref:PROP1-like PPR domain-containing protein n=1 Tax=Zingiber officinale TaxID=94328 RepID=A0A8J5FAS4_ZINOF|nr:hypothetical protein ZIOFF_058230 [Zingiber officinale]